MNNKNIEYQKIKLSKYSKLDDKSIDLSMRTKYFSQRDNVVQPLRTCNSSSNAMYLDWLLRVCGYDGLSSDDGYISRVFDIGDTIYHETQTAAIARYGFSTEWKTDGDNNFVNALLVAGFPVVVNILHRGLMSAPIGGHVIMLIGLDSTKNEYVSHDPYGTLRSNYEDINGDFSQFSVANFKARWQGGYRILS